MMDPMSPDTGEVLRTFLRSIPAVLDITGERIGLSLDSPQPSIRYAFVDGVNIGGGAVMVTWQVECWGPGDSAPDDGTAGLLARTVVAYAPEMHGSIGGYRVAGASADHPRGMDDPLTGRTRVIVEMAFSAHP